MKSVMKPFVVILGFLSLTLAHAQISLGDMAENVLGPAGMLSGFIYKGCYIFGGGLIVASFIQYRRHRQNPSQVRLSQPVALFLFGIVFILLPLVAQLSLAPEAMD